MFDRLSDLTVYAQQRGGGGGTTGCPTLGGVVQSPINICTIGQLITKILEIVVNIGLPVVVVAIVYAGFLYVTARGSEEKLTRAHTAFFWTIIGAAIVLGAFVIQKAIEGTVGALQTGT